MSNACPCAFTTVNGDRCKKNTTHERWSKSSTMPGFTFKYHACKSHNTGPWDENLAIQKKLLSSATPTTSYQRVHNEQDVEDIQSRLMKTYIDRVVQELLAPKQLVKTPIPPNSLDEYEEVDEEVDERRIDEEVKRRVEEARRQQILKELE